MTKPHYTSFGFTWIYHNIYIFLGYVHRMILGVCRYVRHVADLLNVFDVSDFVQCVQNVST